MKIQQIQCFPHTTAESTMAWDTPNGEMYQGVHCILNHSYEHGAVTCGEEILYYSNADGTLSPMPKELAGKINIKHLLKYVIFSGDPKLEKLVSRPALPPKVEQWMLEERQKLEIHTDNFPWFADFGGHFIVFRSENDTVITVLNKNAKVLCQTKFYLDAVRGVYLNTNGNLCYFTETDLARRANRNRNCMVKVFRIE